jgi:hypothetical protein
MKNVVLGGLLAVVLVAACSASEPESSEPAKEHVTSISSSSSSGAAKETTTAPTEPQKDAMQACISDCASKNGEGADQFAAILQPCVCASDVCGQVCGDSCEGSKENQLLASASEECRTCVVGAVKQGGACSGDIQSKCMSQSSCLAFGMCALGCNNQ